MWLCERVCVCVCVFDCARLCVRSVNLLAPVNVFDLVEVVFEMWRDSFDSTRTHLLNLFQCVHRSIG